MDKREIERFEGKKVLLYYDRWWRGDYYWYAGVLKRLEKPIKKLVIRVKPSAEPLSVLMDYRLDKGKYSIFLNSKNILHIQNHDEKIKRN